MLAGIYNNNLQDYTMYTGTSNYVCSRPFVLKVNGFVSYLYIPLNNNQ